MLFRMCNDYAKIGLFVLSILCVRDVAFLMVFKFGQHMNYYTFCILIYMPLELILFCGILSRS